MQNLNTEHLGEPENKEEEWTEREKLQKEITKNRIKAIYKIFKRTENYADEAGQPTDELKSKVKEMARENEITNLTLLRRIANPDKNPDPLSATAIALSYKYPIIIKKEGLSLFENIENSHEMFEDLSKPCRLPGWIGCKKEVVAKYIEISEPPSHETIELVDSLYSLERKKCMEYNKIHWGEYDIRVAFTNKDRGIVKTQEPLIPNVKRSHINMLTAKFMCPSVSVPNAVQELYNENKTLLSSAIPRNLGLTEQVHAIRGLLDCKKRYLPKCKVAYSDEMYQFATSIYGNRWQLEMLVRKGGKIKLDQSKISIREPCNGIISALEGKRGQLDFRVVCQHLYLGSCNIYDMLSEYNGDDTNCLYLKARCGFETDNVIAFTNGPKVFKIFPKNYLKMDESEEATYQFSYNQIAGSCSINKFNLTISSEWCTIKDAQFIMAVFSYLQEKVFDFSEIREEINESNPPTFTSVIESYRRKKHTDNYIMNSNQKSQLYQKWLDKKTMEEHINNITIHSDSSPHIYDITDACAISTALSSSQWGVAPERITLRHFRTVEALPILNISHFVNFKKKKGVYEVKMEGDRHPLVLRPHCYLLEYVSFESRYCTLFHHFFKQGEILLESIERKDYLNYTVFFKDKIASTISKILGHTCTLALQLLVSTDKLRETSLAIIVLLYIFSSNVKSPFTQATYSLEGGYIIDFNFEDKNRGEKNLLWIDEEGFFNLLNDKLDGSNKITTNFMTTLLLQGEVIGHRIEVHIEEVDPDDIEDTIEDAVMELKDQVDGSYKIVLVNAVYYKITRHRTFAINTSASYNRAVVGLKRTAIIDPDSIECFTSGSIKRMRHES